MCLKKLFAIPALVLMLMGGSEVIAQPSYIPANNLLGWWPFNGNANDESPNSYNGVVDAGTVLTADRYGVANKAYRFNVNTGRIVMSNIPVNLTASWSVSFWMRLDSPMNGRVVMDINQSYVCNNTPQFWQYNDHLYLARCANGTVSPINMGTFNELRNVWRHFTVVSVNSNVRIYRDGTLFSSGSHPWPSTSTINMTLGNHNNGSSTNARAGVTVDDIGLWDRALTECEISEIYAADTGLYACNWKVTGNAIDPLTGNNIFGTTTDHDIRVISNNADRGIITKTGSLGWHTSIPTAHLHVNCIDGNDPKSGLSDIRFENLETTKDGTYLIINEEGYVYDSKVPIGGGTGIQNACGTVNMMPRVTNSNGDLDCSQIYDDGASVGISTTGGFGYTSGTGVFTAGSPGSQTVRLDVNGLTRSTTFAATSDATFKTSITTLSNSLEKVNKLRSVSYNWNSTKYPEKGFDNNRHIGFLAQELLEVIPDVVIKDENNHYAVEYNAIIPVLTQAIQEQQKQIEELKAQVQKQGQAAGVADKAENSGYLAQNVPNPFSVATLIRYELPKDAQKAAIGIYDMNGKELRLFQLSAETNGSITIQGNDLKPGMYLYSLIVDGKYFDSKKMVLTSQ